MYLKYSVIETEQAGLYNLELRTEYFKKATKTLNLILNMI